MWNKIKSWFGIKPKTDINKYTQLLERASNIKDVKMNLVTCLMCGERLYDNIELIQHGIDIHGKTFEEMKQLIELTKGN